MKKNVVFIIGVFLVITTESFRIDLSKGSIKKIDKTIESLWPEQGVSKQQLLFTNSQLEKLSYKPSNNFFKIIKGENTIAYACVSNAKSKIMTFDYLVVFDSNLSILKVKMLAYREEYGGEIGSKRWLKQFIGKSDPEKLKFGHDIQGISGATISARNMTNDVKKVIERIIELKKVGVI